nr:MAG TPA: anaerobic ribonucleoside-triphosphate reductase activating protein [Caudoviricetes sp.]
MKIKGLISEDLVNYKKPSMTIIFPYCTFKCGEGYCQNSELAKAPIIEMNVNNLVDRYINNPITEAIVMQGLEPFDSWNDLKLFIHELREYCNDDIVIYTGYDKNEIIEKINELSKYTNIIVKFGRYIPNQEKHFDDLLGVYLASNNQYAEKISND